MDLAALLDSILSALLEWLQAFIISFLDGLVGGE